MQTSAYQCWRPGPPTPEECPYVSNDNFFSTPENTESRLIWNIAPSLEALIEDGPDSYKFDIASSTSFHNKDTTDNFTQVNLGAGVHKEFTSQHRLDVTGDADWLYEPRGAGLTEGQGNVVDELVHYQQQNLILLVVCLGALYLLR